VDLESTGLGGVEMKTPPVMFVALPVFSNRMRKREELSVWRGRRVEGWVGAWLPRECSERHQLLWGVCVCLCVCYWEFREGSRNGRDEEDKRNYFKLTFELSLSRCLARILLVLVEYRFVMNSC